jgi:hypothetical protein
VLLQCYVNQSEKPLYWHTVNPKYKPAFIFVVVVWMSPYLAIVGYYALQFRLGHWPSWLVLVSILWPIANAGGIALLFLAVRKFLPK